MINITVACIMMSSCKFKNIVPIIQLLNKKVPNIKPYYSVSLSSSPSLMKYLTTNRFGLLSGSSTLIHNTLPYSLSSSSTSSSPTNPIICNNTKRSTIDILYSKQSNIQQYVVSNVTELRTLYAFTPNASFWIKTNTSQDGINESKKMFNYVWENKCLYSGLYYDVTEFSNEHIPASAYSHKIAMKYIFSNLFPHLDEIGLRLHNIHINGCNEITSVQSMIDLHSIFKEYQIYRQLSKRGIALQLSVDKLFDLQLLREEKIYN
jgi:hypothetical protein